MGYCKLAAPLAALSIMAMAAPGHASSLYFQGFENNTSGWIVNQDGVAGESNNGSITRTASGGGPLGLPAFQGSYYGTVHNDTNGYQNPGYGSGGFSNLNGNGTTPTPYPGSSFSQSISVYINTATSAPTVSPTGPAFWIDMSPDVRTTPDVYCGAVACSDEHNFQLYYNGSSVTVGVDGGATPVLTIATSGWYTFQDTYAMGATPTSLVNTDLNIFNSSNTLLSSTAELGNSNGETLLSDNLGGPGYIWLPVWQNGFSNDLLGIDNVRADSTPVPEPASGTLFMAALLAAAGFGVFRRRA